MKKLLYGAIILAFMSCGTSKVVKQSEKTLKGNWFLNDVTSTVIGELKITLFNAASRSCFVGSSWEFIPNNNTGSYLLSGVNCNTEKEYFVFTIDEVDQNTGFYDFLLKPTNKRGRSDTNAGYRLELTNLTETTMTWQQTVNFEGKPMKLTFKFSKQ